VRKVDVTVQIAWPVNENASRPESPFALSMLELKPTSFNKIYLIVLGSLLFRVT